MGYTIQKSRIGEWHIWRELLQHMNTYKVVFKKDRMGNLFHEKIKAKNIDEVSYLIRQRYGKDAIMKMVCKER